MQVRLMVERGQDECSVKLAGAFYKFRRNEHGHLVAEISDIQTIKWVSDPRNSSFLPYNPPKPKDAEVASQAPSMITAEVREIAEDVFEERPPVFADVATQIPVRETMNVNPAFEGLAGETPAAVQEGGTVEANKTTDGEGDAQDAPRS